MDGNEAMKLLMNFIPKFDALLESNTRMCNALAEMAERTNLENKELDKQNKKKKGAKNAN